METVTTTARRRLYAVAAISSINCNESAINSKGERSFSSVNVGGSSRPGLGIGSGVYDERYTPWNCGLRIHPGYLVIKAKVCSRALRGEREEREPPPVHGGKKT